MPVRVGRLDLGFSCFCFCSFFFLMACFVICVSFFFLADDDDVFRFLAHSAGEEWKALYDIGSGEFSLFNNGNLACAKFVDVLWSEQRRPHTPGQSNGLFLTPDPSCIAVNGGIIAE